MRDASRAVVAGNLTLAGTTINADSLSLNAANALNLNVQSTAQTSEGSSQGRSLRMRLEFVWLFY